MLRRSLAADAKSTDGRAAPGAAPDKGDPLTHHLEVHPSDAPKRDCVDESVHGLTVTELKSAEMCRSWCGDDLSCLLFIALSATSAMSGQVWVIDLMSMKLTADTIFLECVGCCIS